MSDSPVTTPGKMTDPLRHFIESLDKGALLIHKQGEILFSNKKFAIMVNKSIPEVIGANFWDFFSPEQKQGLLKNLMGRAGPRSEFCLIKLESSWLEVELSCIDELSHPDANLSVLVMDTTENSRLENYKNELISIISHELRTPLTSILGALTLLKGGAYQSAEAHELLELAHKNAEKLSQIVSDIFDAEKIHFGTLEYHFEKLDMVKLIEEAILDLQGLAKKYAVEIHFSKEPNPLPIEADHVRLLQVLKGLLSNAIKASPRGSSVTLESTKKGNRVHVSVHDNGPGIPSEAQARLFDKFSQTQPSSIRTVQGLGLGLYRCKNILKQHAGEIGFNSDSTKGTTFYFEIPLQEEVL